MNKKIVTTLLTLTLAASALIPSTAFAAEPGIQPGTVLWNMDKDRTEESFSLDLTYNYVAQPTYSVTVPQSLYMQEEGTDVWVEVSNAKNLKENNKYVSVKVRDTWRSNFPKNYRDEAHMYNLYYGYEFMKYDVQPKLDDGTYGDALTGFGQELLAFTESGIKYYRVKPVPSTENDTSHPFWGNINFTISTEDIVTK